MATKYPEADAWGVWDTETLTWWKSAPKGTWMTSGAAANAWNSAHKYYERGTSKFSEQKRFVTRPIRFEPLDGPTCPVATP